MKKLFLIIITGTILTACYTSKITSGTLMIKKNNTNINGSWQLEMLFASDNQWAIPPYINISESTFSGNSGCNSISGKFAVNGNYLGVDKNILSTKMTCADTKVNRDEKTFLSALLKINRVTLLKDELELGQGEITLMKFKRR